MLYQRPDQLLLDALENRAKKPHHVVPLAMHCTSQPHAGDNEPISWRDIVLGPKLIAEGTRWGTDSAGLDAQHMSLVGSFAQGQVRTLDHRSEIPTNQQSHDLCQARLPGRKAEPCRLCHTVGPSLPNLLTQFSRQEQAPAPTDRCVEAC
jgi:hypothetical protein